ncbi:hypothetical protein B0T21DRAFT_383748 [Apiosordaria backusii]|uniref:Uncharacterized protein n=1 Tax=Apiosordaria backusii TaxID=314023 RepID=A0AA40BKV1_9PEZI|nr:hypothetical protein B0T21DRAFT_383748 [Apiosordaria backusii]
MSGEEEKVIHQELGPAPPASSTDVGETSKTTNISSVANGYADIKATGDKDIAGQVTPVASVGPVEPLIAAPSSAAPAPESNSLVEPGISKEILTGASTEPSDQPKTTPTESVTLPAAPATIASVDQETNGTTKDVGTGAPQKTVESATPDVLVKPAEIVADKVEEEAKNNVTAHAPVVSANGNTRDDDVEMGEAPMAPDNATAAKAVEDAPSLGGGKRKADEAFGDSNGDLGDTQKPEVSTTNAADGNDIPTKKPGPGRPKKQQKGRKILTPVGRTARKTRSQGPV